MKSIGRQSGERPTVAAWTEQQLATFLASIAQNRLYAAWWLAALRHLQRAEPGGLCWTDIDLQTAEPTVAQQRVHADGQVVVGPHPVFDAPEHPYLPSTQPCLAISTSSKTLARSPRFLTACAREQPPW
ncbi:hypothetical protein ACFWY5_46670 [Nonomuraea sp. NPDC059007]|uniref:hypothetical protein n=1 Tax=Nonomuraea sp. NPDC059007 TaxID=3346692 RepID=UPI0036C597BA